MQLKTYFKISLFVSVTFLMFSCNRTPSAEHYGFLTMLGSDTVSVESITREGNTLTSDEIDRFPSVKARHTVVELNEDGSIRHLVMDIHTPSEPADQRECRVTADVANNEVHLSKKDKKGTFNRDFATGGSIVVAHVPQMYSLYELYFAAAMKHAATSKSTPGEKVDMRQFYIDREFDGFPLGMAHVQPLEGGKMSVTHDWLSGSGDALMDSNYHMLSYSGARTTYKVEVRRLDSPPDIKSIADHFEMIESKAGNVKQLSVHDTMQAQIGNAMFAVDYSRPLMRGRTLIGDVIPYDRVWRTGANAATQFTTSAPIKLGNLMVPAGMYTLWTVPHTSGVELIVNKQTGQWGTEYNSVHNLGITKMNSQESSAPAEEFTISVESTDAKHGTLVMQWGNFKWTAPIEIQ